MRHKPFKKYFDNNVKATKNIIEIANLFGIKKIIFPLQQQFIKQVI
jgi:UDP-glucose 4-epimerase